MPLDGELLCVIGCSVSAVLGSAVAVEDTEEGLETSSGCNLKMALVTVFKSSVLTLRTSEKVKGPVWRYCLSIPMVVNRWRKAVDENTFAAIRKLLKDAYRPTAKI